MVDYRFWDHDEKTWIAQGNDTCCFVYAVANCMVALGRPTPSDEELEEAFDIACCRTGGTIAAKKVVAFFKAPLIETDYPEEVFQQGGIINVWHPFYNGHGFYLDTKCKDRGALRMINSLFGAPIMLNIGKREIQPWVTNRCGSHWKMV